MRNGRSLSTPRTIANDMFLKADVTDLAKGNFNDFTFTLHNHKYTFQALNKAERDGWLVTLEPKISDAKSSREGIVGSEGYKAQLEKFGLSHLPLLLSNATLN